MGLPLLLPLLLLPASLQAGPSTKCNSMYGYEINQPERLSAPEGGSIHIPFSFCHSWELAPEPRVRIFWRRKHFHGEFIYNTTRHFIHKDYKDRLFLNWTEGSRSGSLRISNLRREDESIYYCRVQLSTLRNGKKEWQSLQGTQLTITQATKKTTQSPTSTATTTTADLGVSEGKANPRSWPLSLGAIVGVALAGAVLIIAILGLMIYLRWKRSKGRQATARAPARGSFENTEKCENVGNAGQHGDPKLDPEEGGIVYASLALSSLTSPSAPPSHRPHKDPQGETLYSILKA